MQVPSSSRSCSSTTRAKSVITLFNSMHILPESAVVKGVLEGASSNSAALANSCYCYQLAFHIPQLSDTFIELLLPSGQVPMVSDSTVTSWELRSFFHAWVPGNCPVLRNYTALISRERLIRILHSDATFQDLFCNKPPSDSQTP
jgi:hypothetical protein